MLFIEELRQIDKYGVVPTKIFKNLILEVELYYNKNLIAKLELNNAFEKEFNYKFKNEKDENNFDIFVEKFNNINNKNRGCSVVAWQQQSTNNILYNNTKSENRNNLIVYMLNKRTNLLFLKKNILVCTIIQLKDEVNFQAFASVWQPSHNKVLEKKYGKYNYIVLNKYRDIIKEYQSYFKI